LAWKISFTTDLLTAEGVRLNARATSAPEYPNRSIARTQKIDLARETFLPLPGKVHMLESRSKYPAQIFNDSPHRVEVDIANQLQQMSITCEQSSHDGGKRSGNIWKLTSFVPNPDTPLC
jgi:hypothetical protein